MPIMPYSRASGSITSVNQFIEFKFFIYDLEITSVPTEWKVKHSWQFKTLDSNRSPHKDFKLIP